MEGVGVVNGAVPPNLGILGKWLPEVVIRYRVVGLARPGLVASLLSSKIEQFRLDCLHERIAYKRAGLQYLYADQLPLLIQFCSNIGIQFYTIGLFLIAHHEMQDIFIFEIKHLWFLHGTRNLPVLKRKLIC